MGPSRVIILVKAATYTPPTDLPTEAKIELPGPMLTGYSITK